MRKNFGSKPMMYPMPVLIVAAYDENGKPNAMNAAWGGISEEDEITICLSADHKTTKNLQATGAFTVSMATVETVKACDYVGIDSGNKVADKMEKAGFTTVKSEFVNAPIINELPMALECEVKSYDPETCRLIGRIVNVGAEESVLTNGKIDPEKLNPIIFDAANNTYRAIGAKVADAFSCGLSLR